MPSPNFSGGGILGFIVLSISELQGLLKASWELRVESWEFDGTNETNETNETNGRNFQRTSNNL